VVLEELNNPLRLDIERKTPQFNDSVIIILVDVGPQLHVLALQLPER